MNQRTPNGWRKVGAQVTPDYRLNWEIGEDKVLLVSIGTGHVPNMDSKVGRRARSILLNLLNAPGELMNAAAYDQGITCRVVGRCHFGAPLDREVGDMVIDPHAGLTGRDFTYVRYNPELTSAGLDQLGLLDIDPCCVASLDAVSQLDNLFRIGEAYAERHVDPLSHFCRFVI